MKQQLRNITLALPLLALLLAGCPGDPEQKIAYVDPEILRYGWFPVGSYWVYEKDGVPGQLDSNYVVANKHTFELYDFDHHTGNTLEYEVFSTSIVEKTRTTHRRFYPVGFALEGSMSNYDVEDSTKNPLIYYRDFFYFPSGKDFLEVGDLNDSTTIIIRITSRFTNLQIHGQTYPEAIEVTSYPATQPYEIFSMVWVKDVGIVRKTYVDGSVWSLLRYDIAPG